MPSVHPSMKAPRQNVALTHTVTHIQTYLYAVIYVDIYVLILYRMYAST